MSSFWVPSCLLSGVLTDPVPLQSLFAELSLRSNLQRGLEAEFYWMFAGWRLQGGNELTGFNYMLQPIQLDC